MTGPQRGPVTWRPRWALSLTQYEAPPLVPRGSSLDTTGLIVHLCSYWSTGLLVVTRAFNIHRHISKGLSFLFGLRFRSNYHFRKHVSLRPFTSSIVRGPYAWGPWGTRGILGSLGSPRGYASVSGSLASLSLRGRSVHSSSIRVKVARSTTTRMDYLLGIKYNAAFMKLLW